MNELAGSKATGRGVAFNQGDLVQLKSGSPDLTVDAYLKNPNRARDLVVRWFDGNQPMHHVYPEKMLKAKETA